MRRTGCMSGMAEFLVSTLCPEKSESLKDFATTCVNLHQIKYIFHTHSHIYFKQRPKVSGK